jgi:dsDNA-specific endonuclease/ATPase MutS2
MEIPIDGVLDLHTFNPKDVDSLVPEYLKLCLEKGILSVRIIHGKGTGVLRTKVHAILGKISFVVTFRLGDESSGGWGATLVELKQI